MAYYNNPTENLSVDHLSGEMGVTQKVKRAMQDAARQFVYIGFLLWEVKQYEYFYEGNYNSVYEYAEAELGFKRSSTKNFIAICENFCRKDQNFKELPTMFLDERWSDFHYSQLTEMLSMSEKQREEAKPDMTIKQLRQLKKIPVYTTVNKETGKLDRVERPEEVTGQTSGQNTKFHLINNIWQDISEDDMKEVCRILKVAYLPKSHYNITFQIHKT